MLIKTKKIEIMIWNTSSKLTFQPRNPNAEEIGTTAC